MPIVSGGEDDGDIFGIHKAASHRQLLRVDIPFFLDHVFAGLEAIPRQRNSTGPFINLGAFAPALISIILSGFINPERRSGNNRSKSVIFIIVWFVSGVNLCLFATFVSDALPWGIPLIFVGAFLALLPAYVISSAFSLNKGVRDHLISLFKTKDRFRWFALAVLMIPTALFLGRVLTAFFHQSIPEADYALAGIKPASALLMIILVFLTHLINAGGVAEEPGWRGFALRRLQLKISPLAAGMLVGFLWAFWHIPVMLGALKAFGPLLAVLQVCHLGIVFTWIYNRSGGSLLAVALLHASWNASGGFIPRTPAFHYIMTVVVLIMIIGDHMWKKNLDGAS